MSEADEFGPGGLYDDLLIYNPVVDVYGFDERARFDRAFVKCLWDGVYPGPTEITRRMGNITPNKTINGRLSSRRLELMFWFGVPYERRGAFGERGEIPQPTGVMEEHKGCLTKEMFPVITKEENE